MSLLVHLQDKIRVTGAAISRLENQLSLHPESIGLSANILSMRKLQSNLQTDFAKAADAIGLDIVHYRILEGNPTAKALSSSVGTFQEALTVAYDALRNGPKSRRSPSAVIRAETELRVAYSYEGSFGIVFTVPNERFLIPNMQSCFDRAAETVVKIGKAESHKEILAQAEASLGHATLTAVYDWAKANAQGGIGTAIEWRRGETERGQALIQLPEFAALAESLERISTRTEQTKILVATLVGADVKSHRFHLVTEEDEDIRGKFSDAISESQTADLPGKYRATLHKSTETTYATDEEKVSYFLEKLEQL
jgi:hypothetical protein